MQPAPAAPKRPILLLSFIFMGLFGLFLVGLLVVGGNAPAAMGNRARVGVVEVKDVIMDSRRVLEHLREMVDDDSIKAVVVRIDSPGGSVGPSQEIRSELVRAQKKKHVVASLGSVAASGGYYVAVGAEKIVTNPGTLTGSIGVIIQHPVVTELLRTAKVDMQTYKSGALKDTGSPFRQPNTEDSAYLQGVIAEIAAQFVDHVALARGMDRAKVQAVADGRIITGQKAVELGLADELGTLEDAARLALKLAGEEKEPELVYPARKGGLLADLFDAGAEGVSRGLARSLSTAELSGGLWGWPQAQSPLALPR